MKRLAASLAALLWVVPAAAQTEAMSHVVRAGETLWSISARADVYADPYLWPVIYKFNRDQIVDPSKIYAGQTLQIPIFVDAEARAAARLKAAEQAAEALQTLPN